MTARLDSLPNNEADRRQPHCTRLYAAMKPIAGAPESCGSEALLLPSDDTSPPSKVETRVERPHRLLRQPLKEPSRLIDACNYVL
jgi:hypothetical protein